ncbi:MAG: DUF2259 domain-containing protein [Lentilitoribacter sp.]
MKHLTQLITFFTILLISTISATAGDFAEFRSLGFSKDGKVFGFEQFGVQDGSGFPYAERYFIDTATDRYIKGTPFRIRIEDENASLFQARQMAKDASQATMESLGIGSEHASILAFNPSTEKLSDPYLITFQSFSYEPNPNSPNELKLELIDLTPSKDCENITPDAKGFKLVLSNDDSKTSSIVHEDKSVPKSRNCPIDYQIGGVLAFNRFNQIPVFIYLVLVRSFGFEGPDGRWIAIAKQGS